MHEASKALDRRYGLSGISLDAGFFEMVEACNRKFNTRLNDFDPEPDPALPKLQNPYYRGQQGMK